MQIYFCFLCIFTFDFCGFFTFGFCGSQRMQRAVDVLWGPQWALTECIQWGESERRNCMVWANERDRKRQTVGKCKRKLPARHESAVSTYLHKQRLYNRCLPVYIHTSVANTMQRYCFLLRYASYIQ